MSRMPKQRRYRSSAVRSAVMVIAVALLGGCFAESTPPETRPTGAREAAILAASEAESRNVEENSLAARVERSLKGELVLDVPSQLAAVADGAKGVLSAISPSLTMVSTHHDDVVSFEEIMYSDGVGYLIVATQLWPLGIDPSGMVEPGAVVETIGQLDYITYDENLPGADTTSVKIYDGQRMVKVEVVNIVTSAEKVRVVALALYEGYGAAS